MVMLGKDGWPEPQKYRVWMADGEGATIDSTRVDAQSALDAIVKVLIIPIELGPDVKRGVNAMLCGKGVMVAANGDRLNVYAEPVRLKGKADGEG